MIELITNTGERREMTINMGPQHPSTHGVLRLELVLDGEIIKKVKPHIGFLHRCFEKYAEKMDDYAKVIPYTDRMDYVSAMNQEHGYVVALERMLELEVPEKVEHIRVIVAELQRIASHLLGIGAFGLDLGAFTPFLYLFIEREKILDIFEKTSGARLLYNYMAVGGLMRDVHPDFKTDVADFVKTFRPKIKELDDLLSYNKIFVKRTANIGILPEKVGLNYGASGPVLRGSGVKWDLRKNDPYSIYDQFEFDIPIGSGEMGTLGDCWDRYNVRVREMEQSLRIIEQALDTMPDEGDVKSAIPKRIRMKEGEIYVRTETPRGELGYFIAGDNSASPFRVKARAPSFVHLSMLAAISQGSLIADMVAIVGSIDIVLGEVDR